MWRLPKGEDEGHTEHLGHEGGEGKANKVESFHVFPPSNMENTKAFVVGVEAEVSPCHHAAIKHKVFGLCWSNSQWKEQTFSIRTEQQGT